MQRIIIIGYMGAGKTTVGKALANALGMEFYDLDWYIEARMHKTVPQLFAERGEEGFRLVERAMLHEAAEFEGVVLSCGGGTPCFFDNIDYMNAHGTCIYLKATTDELCHRLANGRDTRPLLQGKNDEELRQYIEHTLSQRAPFYSRAALHFDTGTLNTRREIDNTVERLLQHLRDKQMA